MAVQIIQSSAAGGLFKEHTLSLETKTPDRVLQLDSHLQFQEISGFGGAFTESSAHLLQQLSPAKRREILAAYFSAEGARYSLCRTTINSCDFSLGNYAYTETADDTLLLDFDIKRDQEAIIPTLLEAQEISKNGFKIIATPWTAPPWMKDNGDWNGGKLLKKYYDSWALYFVKYLEAYSREGIDIWGLTIENEPLGNDANWESMHYSPEEMADFIKHHLGPQLAESKWDPKLFVYDQNRGKELEEWAQVLLTDPEVLKYTHGTAVHWYTHTQDWMPKSLQYTHELAPNKAIIHTEACIDAEVPHWKDDAWYWTKEATDWGWDWAPEEDKKDHPKYVPVYRYARDIIGCLNNQVAGWMDWNLVLDRQGGPNHAKNWCIAPVIVDTTADEVYYTPLYYTMKHFSRFIQPGAVRIAMQGMDLDYTGTLFATAVKNPDQSIVCIVLNTSEQSERIEIKGLSEKLEVEIGAQTLQTLIIKPKSI